MKHHMKTLLLAVAISSAVPGYAQNNTASPISVLVPGVPLQLTSFGERPSWSRDGAKLAFMSKAYGDAYEIDLATQELTLLTPFPHGGYLRAQYLSNGDMFLIGNRYHDETFDILDTRTHDQEMWILPRGARAPIALNESIYEGVAISTQRNLIAFSQNFQSNPSQFAFNESGLFTAEIVYNNGTPSLTNKRELRRAFTPACVLEAQDFRNNDTELVYNCYPQYQSGYGSEILKVILETNQTDVLRALYPDEFNESEGIYPNGNFITVESSRDNPDTGDGSQHLTDIWRLSLEPPYDDMVRLTFFTQNPPNKVSNPVISPDGKTMALQYSRLGTQAGVGFGILLVAL